VAIALAWALMVEQLFELIPGVESIRPWLPFRSAKEFLTADAGAGTGIFGGGPWVALGYFVVVAVVLLGAAIAVAQRRDA
jgi:ABC-2 type transport system permease protein